MNVKGKKKTRECISRSEVRCFWRRQMEWERRQALWLERTSWLFTCWRGWIDRAREHTLPSCTSYETGRIIVMQTHRNLRKGCLPYAVCLSFPYRTQQSVLQQINKQTNSLALVHEWTIPTERPPNSRGASLNKKLKTTRQNTHIKFPLIHLIDAKIIIREFSVCWNPYMGRYWLRAEQ
jgi:hypothetical protein